MQPAAQAVGKSRKPMGPQRGERPILAHTPNSWIPNLDGVQARVSNRLKSPLDAALQNG
jgi:hypothetical protein